MKSNTKIRIITLKRIPFILIAVFYSARSWGAGFYADDAGFIANFFVSPTDFVYQLRETQSYVPGRNLHVVWQNLLYFLSGPLNPDFSIYHVIQSLLYVLVGYYVSEFLLLIGLPIGLAVCTGLLAIVCPVWLDVLLWPSALPMHILSTLFFLKALYIFFDCQPNISLSSSIWMVFLLISALFTYEQVALPILILAFYLTLIRYRPKIVPPGLPSPDINRFVFIVFQLLVCIYVYIMIFFRTNEGGPFLSSESLRRGIVNTFFPLRIFLEIRKSGLTNTASFFGVPNLVFISLLVLLSGTFFLFGYWVLRLKLQREIIRNKDFFLPLFGFLAIATYIPAAIWYVAPRHLMLPGIFMLSLLAVLLNQFSLQGKILSSLRLALVLVFSCLLIVSNTQIDAWKSRNAQRNQIYENLYSRIQQTDSSLCIRFLFEKGEGQLFYSESESLAIRIYNRLDLRPGFSCLGTDKNAMIIPTLTWKIRGGQSQSLILEKP